MVAVSFEASSVKASDSVDDAVKIATRSVGDEGLSLTNRMAASFACAKSPELVLTSSKKSAINLGTAAAAALGGRSIRRRSGRIRAPVRFS